MSRTECDELSTDNVITGKAIQVSRTECDELDTDNVITGKAIQVSRTECDELDTDNVITALINTIIHVIDFQRNCKIYALHSNFHSSVRVIHPVSCFMVVFSNIFAFAYHLQELSHTTAPVLNL